MMFYYYCSKYTEIPLFTETWTHTLLIPDFRAVCFRAHISPVIIYIRWSLSNSCSMTTSRTNRALIRYDIIEAIGQLFTCANPPMSKTKA